jgi:hypothetical protein
LTKSSTDIITATATLTAPRYFFAPLTETLIILDTRGAITESSLRNLGTAFPSHWAQSDLKPLRDLDEVLQSMAAYTIIASNHSQGIVVQDSPKLADMRNFVQHGLLSLPPAETLCRVPDSLYEATRLAAMAYALLVTYPIHGPKAPFAEIASRLRIDLSCLDPRKEKEVKLLLWILVIGAIVGMNTANRRWFVRGVREFASRLGIETWEGVKEILGGFLWLGSTSDRDGRNVWNEVEEVN